MDGQEKTFESPYKEVFGKIGYYRANSFDESFHNYLDQKLEEAEKGLKTPADLLRDLDYNYARYRQYAGNDLNNSYAGSENKVINNPDYVKNYEENKSKRTEIEIKVGAGILSVIGAVFVIVALVYFGTYFLDEIFQGIAIFAGAAIIILLSELLLEKRLPYLAHIMTGIGFCGLYFGAIFSCAKLKMYDHIVAIGIIFAIALVNVLFARFRKSPVMEIVCAAGGVSFAYALGNGVAPGVASFNDVYILAAATFIIVNLVLFIAPYKTGFRTSKIIRLVFVTVTAFYMYYADEFSRIPFEYMKGMAVLSILTVLIAYAFNTPDMSLKVVSLVSAALMCLMIPQGHYEVDLGLWISVIGLLIACFVPFLIMIKKKEKWAPYSLFMITLPVIFWGFSEEMLIVLVTIGVLVVSKLLLSVKELAPTDAIITVIALITAIVYRENLLAYIILAVALIGAIMCTRLKLFHEFILLAGGLTFALLMDYYPSVLKMPVWMSVVFVLLLLFNLIPTMQVKGTLVYNIISVVMIGFGIILAPLSDYDGWDLIVLLCTAALAGILVCLVFLRKKFLMDTNARYIILAVVLTYLALFMDIGNLWISISLMAVAFIVIAVGCVANRFELRIYGLVLSLAVCVKVAFYDFKNESEFNRMIVFLVVGLLAIAISFVYLILEKKEQNELKALKAAKEKENIPCEGQQQSL